MRLLPLALLLLTPALAGTARVQDPSSDAVLLRVLRALGDPARELQGLDTDLAAMGPGVAPELLRLVDRGAFLATRSDGSTVRLALGEAHLGKLHRALDQLPLSGLRAVLRAAELDEGQRAQALLLLGNRAGRDGLGDLMALARDGDSGRPTPLVREAFVDGLASLARREPSVISRVQGTYPTCDPRLRTCLPEALADVGGEQAMLALAEMSQHHESLLPFVLSQVGKAADSVPKPAQRAVADVVIAGLVNPTMEVRLAAVEAASGLEEVRAIPDLVALLADEHPGVAKAAGHALRRVTRQHLYTDHAAWRSRLEAEQRWWREEAPNLLTDVDTGDPQEAALAINELSRRTWHRHEVAVALAADLPHLSPTLARMACAALGRLGSSKGVDALTAALEHAHPEVRDEAAAALQRLQGTRPRPTLDPREALPR